MVKMTIEKARDLERILKYEFKDIGLLIDAMNVTKISKRKQPYHNGALAVVGDAILKAVLADYFYFQLKKEGSDIHAETVTTEKLALENNGVLHAAAKELNLMNYAWNDGTTTIPTGGHDLYVEAVVAAIFHDSGFDKCKEWILTFLLPLLQKNK